MSNIIEKIASILKLEGNWEDPGEADREILLGRLKELMLDYEDYLCAFEASADSIHIADGDGKILKVNAVFEKYTMTDREKVLGINVRDAVEEGVYEPSVVALAIAEKRQLTMMQQSKEPGIDVITTSTPIFNDDGSVFRVISNARPVENLTLLYDYYRTKKAENTYEQEEVKAEKYVFKDPHVKELAQLISHIAPTDSSVLLVGESGTGKSRIARDIHDLSDRRDEPFVEINCGAIPPSLMESELFGYETGAFTGAKKGGQKGFIEAADKGTIFLDEIAEIPLIMQSKLLHVVQNKTITRVGSRTEVPVDIRIISATNKDLKRAVEEGTFRNDLYYRLNVIPIELPPLRERKVDIWPMADHFLQTFNRKYGKNIAFSEDLDDHLTSQTWPGNIRELENLIERLVLINTTGIITPSSLEPMENQASIPSDFASRLANRTYSSGDPEKGPSLQEAMERLEKDLILGAYKSLKSSYKVADYLSISQSAAARKIKKYLSEDK